jgi:histidinol dehydrogenase
VRRVMKVYRAEGRSGARRLDRLAGRGREVLDRKTVKAAGRIVERVRRGGDAALLAEVRRLDGYAAGSVAELAGPALRPDGAASAELPDGFEEALGRAIESVERYHRGQVHAGFRLDEAGLAIEELRTPLDRVGIYVPGGRAAYPSTVVMTAVPARLAGVRELVVATPPATLRSSAALRYTLDRLGIDEVWGMGGAHAIAALAYGTGTIRRVDKIVGPGNAWVTAAKSRVAGDVGIDSLAGPSEVVIVAAGVEISQGAVDRIAADLLAQAEHDPRAAAVLVTDDRRLAKAVARRVEERLAGLDTREVAAASLSAFGGAFVVQSIDQAAELVGRLAPEHLQLVGPGAEALADRRPPLPAGAIFVGTDTPEVFGDYVAGPSHVLPTCGTARFASALGVEDFVRRSHVVRATAEAARALAPVAEALARAEGLPGHAQSARLRAVDRGESAALRRNDP